MLPNRWGNEQLHLTLNYLTWDHNAPPIGEVTNNYISPYII